MCASAKTEIAATIVPVLGSRAGEAREKLTKLAKRAARYDQVIAWTETARTEIKAVKRWDGKSVDMAFDFVDFAVTGEAPRVGDFKFLAKMERVNGSAIITGVPGVEIGNIGRDWDGRCEHCNKNRARTVGFVVEGEGGRKIVGKSCLRDHMGTDVPSSAINVFTMFASIEGGDEDEDGFGGFGGGAWYDSTLGIIAASRAAIAIWGWIPASQAQMGGFSTSGYVSLIDAWHIKPKDPAWKDKQRLIEEMKLRGDHYQDEAEKVMVWGENLQPRNDYEHNLKTAIMGKTVPQKFRGIVVSAAAAYDKQVAIELKKAEEKKAKAALPASTHFGQEKVRSKGVIVTVEKIIGLGDYGWGPQALYLMRTDCGSILKWKTAASGDRLIDGLRVAVGARLKADFLVKEFSEYNGDKQTCVNRVKFQALVAEAA